jgi:tetratricopeptide (TPR) repeat protein
VRTALEWSFSTRGDTRIGVALAAAAAPVFLAMSLLTECHRWSTRALDSLPQSARGGSDEMHLQAGLGMSMMFIRDHGGAALDALSRSLSIAEEHGDAANQLLLLGPLHMFHFRRGEYKRSLDYAKRSEIAAIAIGDPAAIALAHCLTGISLHSMGELTGARMELEGTLRHEPASRGRTLYLGFDYYNWAGMALGRTLWMQGHTEEALVRVRQTVHDAERLGHPVTLTIVLHWAAAVYLWSGDLETAEAHVDWFLSRAETLSLGPYLAVAHGLKGELAIRRGDAIAGVEMLQGSLAKLRAARYELVTTAFKLALAGGLNSLGRISEAIQVIDETVEQVKTNGDLAFLPELLRIKSRLLLSLTPSRQAEAQLCLAQSIDWARQQSARAWELRSTTDLAALLLKQGRSQQAQALLLSVLDQFTGRSDTADLETARQLLVAVR